MDQPASPLERIRRPSPGLVREVWSFEGEDFTPWLARHLEYLDVLGLGPLRLVRTEAPVPDTYRALDILVETADERRMAIENQFGVADHDHLTRGLAYAVGLGAAALVIVAEAHRPEFVAVARYLNEAAEGRGLDEGGIGVYLVELSVERLEGWYLPRFVLVEGPNAWLSRTALSRPARLTGVDQFLDQVSGERRDTMSAIVRDWTSRPGGSVTHNAASAVALRIPKPAAPGTVAVLTAQLPGTIWLNRGYLVTAVEPAGLGEREIDDLIHSTWPSARPGEKHYYLTVAEPEFSEYRAFADGLWRLIGTVVPEP
jgi:hypothetical protein